MPAATPPPLADKKLISSAVAGFRQHETVMVVAKRSAVVECDGEEVRLIAGVSLDLAAGAGIGRFAPRNRAACSKGSDRVVRGRGSGGCG